MIFADTHTHLYLDAFDADRIQVVQAAIAAGVQSMFLPNIDSSSWQPMKALRQQYPSHCFAMAGLHPTSVKGNYREELTRVEQELDGNPGMYCAIGEIGIDLYWDKTYQKEQEDAFIIQLRLAVHYGLPVVIHTRNSMDYALNICEKTMNECGQNQDGTPEGNAISKRKPKGIFHCFSGNLFQAQRAIRLGFRLGIGGVITYKNSGLQQVVEAVPLETLVLETDAPFLAPVPHRGKRNEPSYIPLIAAKIAEIKGITIKEVAEVTTRETAKIFN